MTQYLISAHHAGLDDTEDRMREIAGRGSEAWALPVEVRPFMAEPAA